MNARTYERRDGLASAIFRFAVVIVLGWVAVAAVTNAVMPQLEEVARVHNAPLSAPDAPSGRAISLIGQTFGEFTSDGAAVIVLEGQMPLGLEAHQFYDTLIDELKRDPAHVEYVQDLWGDPLTAAGSQSSDGKAAVVQVYLVGNQGQADSTASVDAVRHIISTTPAPPGVTAYLTGAAPLIADQFEVGSSGAVKVTVLTLAVIALMLLLTFRSVSTTVLLLLTVIIELAAARGIVAALGSAGLISLSTYATNLLTLLVIAAGTDYAIFFLGRYHEARQTGQHRDAALRTMYSTTVLVVAGSGLTVAGAVFCLSFGQLPYFKTMGIPASIAVLVGLAAALTLGPAVIALGTRVGLLQARRSITTRRWRRVGTAVVRWPGPILVATLAAAIIGLLALPSYATSYDVRNYLPSSAPANAGYAAAARHFSANRLSPDLLMLKTKHDLRNPAGMILLERVAKAVFHVPGIAQVQSITRPSGSPIPHTSIPFQISVQSTGQIENLPFQADRARDFLTQARQITKTIDLVHQQYSLQKSLAATAHQQAQAFDNLVGTIGDVRDKIANLDDFLRPLRSYFYWEPHCQNIPVCLAFRSVFDALDGVDSLSGRLGDVTRAFDQLDALQPKLLALIPPQLESQQVNRDLTLGNYATNSGINAQTRTLTDEATALGEAFDEARTDDSFYLAPGAFSNPEFRRGLVLFLSADGTAARMIVIQDDDPASPEGVTRVQAIRAAVADAVKGTSLAGADLYLAGVGPASADIHDMNRYDLLIVGLAALTLITLIMLLLTQSVIAALVIVGTVALSLGASFGLSVLVWQHLLGIPLYWIVAAVAVIVLLAAGSDYNLLLISRFQEEMPAGLKTGVIRAMGSTGSIVTAAGLVFAATMAAFVFSDLRVLGQIGTTISLGLLFDTLIVRAFMTPAMATLLGRWFWWPRAVRTRPARATLGLDVRRENER